MSRPVHIHYHRPPDRTRVYVQDLVLDAPDVKVSFQRDTPVDRPLVVDGRTILEAGSPVVWFTFPDRWHDIGRFHTADGTFTGLYANILTPAELHRPDDAVARWSTTDLFLDVWVGADGTVRILDEEEWADARDRGLLDAGTAERARREADALVAAAGTGAWPPPVVPEWTLERARAAVGHPRRSAPGEPDDGPPGAETTRF